MSYEIQVVEAFAFTGEKRSLGWEVMGNPAGICIMDTLPDREVMSEIAKELSLPITAFLEPIGGTINYKIRYFSASGYEFSLCGHATATAAKVVAKISVSNFIFHLNPSFNGNTSVKAWSDGSRVTLFLPALGLLMPDDYNQLIREVVAISNVTMENIAGISKSELFDFIIELNEAQKLRELDIDYRRLSELASGDKFPHRGMIFTTRSEEIEFHFESRAFFPGWGIDEDIACGTANCGVVPYWFSKHLGGDGNVNFKMFYPYKGTNVGGVQDIFYDVQKHFIKISCHVRTGRTFKFVHYEVNGKI